MAERQDEEREAGQPHQRPDRPLEPGLGGFESLRRYALIGEADSPVEWLQSLDDPDVSFALLEPFLFRPDYVFELPDRDAEAIGMTEPADALVRCILTLSEQAEQITANLLAPIVVNTRLGTGRQVILQDSNYSLQHRIQPEVLALVASEGAELGFWGGSRSGCA